MHKTLVIFLLLPLLSAYCEAASSPPDIHYRIIQALPHNSKLFTQGLVIEGDILWESSGLFGRSLLQRRQKSHTDAPLNSFRYPSHHFAEGLATVGDKLYGLTWKSGVVYRWQKHNLKPLQPLQLKGEGWGVANWQGTLAISNGSPGIGFYNPTDMSLLRTIEVNDNGLAVNNLNDLTSDGKTIWANIWHSNRVIRIDAITGAVSGRLNLSKVAARHPSTNSEAVLNGIAWDQSSQTLWLTGKYWNKIYQLELLTSAPGTAR